MKYREDHNLLCRCPQKLPARGVFVLYIYDMTLEEKLDEIFSLYTRLRFADYRGLVHCYTCTAVVFWKELDCGHWIRRQHEAVRWNENNARPQCYDCNRMKNGMSFVFEQELREEIGDDSVDELQVLSLKTKYLDDEKKNALLVHYKKLVKQLDSTL